MHQKLKEPSLLASSRTSIYISRVSCAADLPAIFTQRAGDSKYRMTDIRLREVYYDANRGSHKSSRLPSIQRIDGGYLLNSHERLHSQQKEAPVQPFVALATMEDVSAISSQQKLLIPRNRMHPSIHTTTRWGVLLDIQNLLYLLETEHILKDTTCDYIVTTQAALLIGSSLREARSAL